MRQRVNSLEEDLDRQRQKAITATEAYQKMVVDLQQRHAGTVAELEMALKELEQLQGYKDLYSKIESGQASKDSQGMAAMMQENLGLKSEIATLRQELQAEKERTDVAGRANSRQSVLDDEQVREHEEVRRTGAHPSAPDFAPAAARELPAQGVWWCGQSESCERRTRGSTVSSRVRRKSWGRSAAAGWPRRARSQRGGPPSTRASRSSRCVPTHPPPPSFPRPHPL